MTYLISISIGPVQDFISTARRCRDLWFGSWLLSELSKTAARTIRDSNGTLIFPSALSNLDEGSDFSAVNKIVALVGDPPEIVKQIRGRLREQLERLQSKAFGKIGEAALLKSTSAAAQINDLLEFFWAAASCENPENAEQYCTARNEAEALLAARKATRNFKATDEWAEHMPKSSLDGLRESVIFESVYDDVRLGRKSEEWLRHNFGVRPGERLCGVGLLKRLGNRGNDNFFSTSHVASLPLLSTLNDATAADDYISQLKKAGVKERDLNKVPLPPSRKLYPPAFQRNDGHLLFEERLRDYFSDKQNPDIAKANFEKAQLLLRKFLKDAFGEQRPEPYYALLLGDGDRMGQAIDAQRSMGNHQKLSDALSTFAQHVRNIVEDEHHGSLVYAGGDDVLAFLPLHTVLQCAYRLNQEFSQQFQAFSYVDDGQHFSPTLSVGIVVAHHLDPLSDTLELVRAAEKQAKTVPGKDALAITVSKRSGADLTVKGRWSELDQRLDWFVILHRSDALPDGIAYELRDLSLRLNSRKPKDGPNLEEKENYESLQKAMRYEAVRVLHRKRGQQGLKKVAQDILDELEVLINPQPSQEKGGPEPYSLSIESLARELIAARVFAKATQQAAIKIEMLEEQLKRKKKGKEPYQ